MNLDSKKVTHDSYCLMTDWGRVISSAVLLGKEKSVVILHDGQKYRLSITKLRKLILTK